MFYRMHFNGILSLYFKINRLIAAMIQMFNILFEPFL